MIRDKSILQTRNTLSRLVGWCDSAAAINASKMTEEERHVLQEKIWGCVKWIDKKLGF